MSTSFFRYELSPSFNHSVNKTNKTNTCIRFAKIGFFLEELATRPVCLHMITTLPHNLIEDKLIDPTADKSPYRLLD